MPELPEVETTCRALNLDMAGKHIGNVSVRRRDLRYSIDICFEQKLWQQKVTKVTRRAKYILVYLANSTVWMIHLGMSGSIRQGCDFLFKHDHVQWQCGDNSQDSFIFHDPRRFGFMGVLGVDEMENSNFFKKLGKEPLDATLTLDSIQKKVGESKRPIKSILLDQTIIVGVGNIYASEALWLSYINPERLSYTLTSDEWQRLLSAIRVVLKRAIDLGGSTLRDYTGLTGESGSYQNEFKAYGRFGKRCGRQINDKEECDGVIMRIKQSNRSTYYCEKCAL